MSSVIFSSSYDEKYPPENILNENSKSFFTGTGMFPQEICIQFDQNRQINSLNLKGYGIKKIRIETCENDSVVNFKKQVEQSEIPAGNGLQNIKLNLTKSANVKVLKIEVLEGHEDFFSIHTLSIM